MASLCQPVSRRHRRIPGPCKLPRSMRVLSFVIASACWAAAASGQQLAPPRWPPAATILVWIDRGVPPAGELVERAMKVWTAAGGGRFSLQRTADRKSAGVVVRFIRPEV